MNGWTSKSKMRTRDAAASRHAHLSILGILVALRGYGLVYSGKLFWSTILGPASSSVPVLGAGAWMSCPPRPCQVLAPPLIPCTPPRQSSTLGPRQSSLIRCFSDPSVLPRRSLQLQGAWVPGEGPPPLHSLCTFTSLWPHNRFVVFPWVPTPFRLVSQQKPTACFFCSDRLQWTIKNNTCCYCYCCCCLLLLLVLFAADAAAVVVVAVEKGTNWPCILHPVQRKLIKLRRLLT